jgi:putative hemolysin
VSKRIALNNAEPIASLVAAPLRVLSTLASPIVRVLNFSTASVRTILRIRPSTASPLTEKEINVLIEQGAQAGTFAETERDMVASVFRLHDQHVSVLMTPRKDIVWLDVNDSLEEIRYKTADCPYSHFPVGQGNLDNALGIVLVKDLLACSLAGQPIDLRVLLRPAAFVPEGLHVSRALDLFRRTHEQIALVVDEYGVVKGLLTLNDVIAAIVGDIPEHGESLDSQVLQREDGSWLLDGMLPVDKFKEIFHLAQLPGEERGYYQTLGGFLMMYMEHIPVAGQYFEWGGFRFEVVDMDLHRVDKVLVAPARTTLG